MKIMGFDKKVTDLKFAKESFEKYRKDNKIKTCEDLKNNLINIFFNDFTEVYFNLVYNNSNYTTWEILSEDLYLKLLRIK